jgi:hypothetical protein
VAPVPKLPPVIVRVLLTPLQVLLFAIFILVGSVDRLPTVTAKEAAALVPQLLLAVTVIFPPCPAKPVVTVIEIVPIPESIVHPAGTAQV